MCWHLASGTWLLTFVGGEDEVRRHLAPDGGEDGGEHGYGQGAPGVDQRVSGQCKGGRQILLCGFCP